MFLNILLHLFKVSHFVSLFYKYGVYLNRLYDVFLYSQDKPYLIMIIILYKLPNLICQHFI